MRKKLIENYLESKTDHYAEISSDNDFLEKIFRMEMVLQDKTKSKVKNNPKDILSPAKEKKLFKLAEKFIFENKPNFRISDKAIWKQIFSNSQLLSYFQDLVLFISSEETGDIKTPSYLKKIIQKKISENTKVRKNITILIKDSLKLLNQNLDNLFEIPLLQEAVSTRYAGNIPSGSNILQFLNKQDDGTEIIFQVLKDGEDTVTMSLNLERSSVLPSTVTLRKNNRIVQKSNPVRRVILYNQLTIGSYQIELGQGKNNFKKVINFNLVTDSAS